jgi:hypothetical protein
MAKAPKRSTPADFDLLQWMSFNEAQLHVTQVVGRLDWAGADLVKGIVSGEIEAIELQALPGGGFRITRLTPEDFRPVHVDDWGRLRTPGGFNFLEDHQTVYLRRAVVERMWRTELPRKWPADVDRKVWLVVTTVWALWGEGYRWPHQEALRLKVCERLRWGEEDLSLPTVKTALGWLRKENYIDL